MSPELLETMQAVNNTLTIADVRPHFQAHYANAQTDVHGILALVKDILKEQAVFPRGTENTELRKIVVSAAMFTADILTEVERRFAAGGGRYKIQTVKNVLSTYGKNEIVKVKLSNEEDQPRDCCKPRAKWYLLAKKDE